MTKVTAILLAVLLATPAGAQQALSPRDSALHALNRLAWGATPGLVDSVARTGVMRWIEAQLSPEAPGDPAMENRERPFAVLSTPSADLVQEYLRAQREARVARRGDSMAGRRRPGPGERMDPAMLEQRRLRRIGPQLQQLTLVRAVSSTNQLGEVVADFWFNHFNVFQNKGLDRPLLPGYVEWTIRPHSLGRFETLLVATAESPAMLFYLDNVRSVAPGATPPELERLRRLRNAGRGRMVEQRRRRADSLMQEAQNRMPRGLNENYARELLELHTLGVDGGYSQRDVTEVARILTGWGTAPPPQGARFEFHDWAHDEGAKSALGTDFPAGGGRQEGLRLLGLLAAHPSTRHHLSSKLCERLVSDLPSDGCIDAAARAWSRNEGDIRAVLRAVVRSPDFWAPAAIGSKIKTPMEFVVSAVRSVGGEADSTPRLAQQVARLGQPLYLQSAPTGYPETQEDWVNSGALLARMNFAMALAAGRVPGVWMDLDRVVPLAEDATVLVEAVDRVILNGQMSPHTRSVILQELAGIGSPVQARALAVGLAIGGPEFQRQ